MEKDCFDEIRQKLNDVPGGKCLAVRCMLNRGEAVRDFEDQSLPSDARIKTVTYELYPGIEISYNYFIGEKFHFHHRHRISVMAIDHCCRGRMGWEMGDGLSLYFGEGDLSFHMNAQCSESEITLPLGYYQGLSLSLDIDELEKRPPEIIREAGIDIRSLCQKSAGNGKRLPFPRADTLSIFFPRCMIFRRE